MQIINPFLKCMIVKFHKDELKTIWNIPKF